MVSPPFSTSIAPFVAFVSSRFTCSSFVLNAGRIIETWYGRTWYGNIHRNWEMTVSITHQVTVSKFKPKAFQSWNLYSSVLLSSWYSTIPNIFHLFPSSIGPDNSSYGHCGGDLRSIFRHAQFNLVVISYIPMISPFDSHHSFHSVKNPSRRMAFSSSIHVP